MNEYTVPTNLLSVDDLPKEENLPDFEFFKKDVEKTLKVYGFSGKIKSVTEGPTVVTFFAECTKGVPLQRVPSVERSLSNRFGCSVICLPCFSSGAIEIQISRRKRIRVDLCDVLTSESYQKTCKNGLLFAMGVDAGGKALCKDLTDLCCLALAGESGTGKSVFLHSFLTGLICKYSPEELRLLLIDLKGGEFVPAYDKLPHLVTESAVMDLAAAMHMLDWAIEEGEKRKGSFAEISNDDEYVSTLDEYNEIAKTSLPKIVVVIDELNELYLNYKKEFSQKNRAPDSKCFGDGDLSGDRFVFHGGRRTVV